MPKRAELLFHKLTSEAAIEALIGEPEDVHFDAKEWHANKSRECLKKVADAACAFANASGGVITIGLSARKNPGGEADLVDKLCPFSNPSAVASQVLDAIVQWIEPGISGIVHRVVPTASDGSRGYVIVHVPESDSLHRLATGCREFLQRIGSSSLKMEYFQIRDRFGRRPHAQLLLEIDSYTEVTETLSGDPWDLRRILRVSIQNDGRGIAHWPCIFVPYSPGVNLRVLPHSGVESLWPIVNHMDGSTSLRGTSEHVVYPSERLVVAALLQRGETDPLIVTTPGSSLPYRSAAVRFRWHFPAVTLAFAVACEGLPITEVSIAVPEYATKVLQPGASPY